MADRYHFVEANIQVKLTVTCVDRASVAINLAGCTISLRWRTAAGIIENRAMTIEDATAGKVSYTFLVDELVPPAMEYEVTVTKPGGAVISSLTSEILGIRARLTA